MRTLLKFPKKFYINPSWCTVSYSTVYLFVVVSVLYWCVWRQAESYECPFCFPSWRSGGGLFCQGTHAPALSICRGKNLRGKGGGVPAEHLKINYKMWWKIVSYQLHLLWNVLNNQRSGSRHFFLNIIVNTTNYFPNLSNSVNNLFDASYSRFSHMSTFS